MKRNFVFPALVLIFQLTSCREKPAEVEISETRELTSLDEDQVLNATSAEQFLPAEFRAQIQGAQGIVQAGAEWTYQLPAADWKEAPTRQFRDVNLTFGEGESAGEAYLSVVGGGVQPNVVRWFRQFGNTAPALSELGELTFLGKKAYLIETSGRYEPGMGRPAKGGQALLGAIVDDGGRQVTVKMIGPEAEINSRRDQFLKFVASLKRK